LRASSYEFRPLPFFGPWRRCRDAGRAGVHGVDRPVDGEDGVTVLDARGVEVVLPERQPLGDDHQQCFDVRALDVAVLPFDRNAGSRRGPACGLTCCVDAVLVCMCLLHTAIEAGQSLSVNNAPIPTMDRRYMYAPRGHM
jgi:hypothetical protein